VSVAFLRGRMALLWTGSPHVTYENTDKARNYEAVQQAGALARDAVLPGQESVQRLAEAVAVSYQVQLQEGMPPLPDGYGELARKYCGGGWGGYALFLFDSEQRRDALLQLEGAVAIEPYIRS
jgi:hypothetical protein